MKLRKHLSKALRFYVGSPKCRLATYIIVHAIIIFCVVKRMQSYTHNGTEMAQQAYHLKTLIADSDKWKDRSSWISQKVPRFIRHEDAKAKMISIIDAAKKKGGNVQVHEIHHQQFNQLTATNSSEHFEKVSAEITFSGSEKEVVAFIHQLQIPKNFIGIDHLAIDLTDYGDLSCEVRLTQWFLPPWRQIKNISVNPKT